MPATSISASVGNAGAVETKNGNMGTRAGKPRARNARGLQPAKHAKRHCNEQRPESAWLIENGMVCRRCDARRRSALRQSFTTLFSLAPQDRPMLLKWPSCNATVNLAFATSGISHNRHLYRSRLCKKTDKANKMAAPAPAIGHRTATWARARRGNMTRETFPVQVD